jgi:hypothetical protein
MRTLTPFVDDEEQKELEEVQIENASGDAWYLFSECFHISREDYLFGMTDEINDKEAEERYKKIYGMQAVVVLNLMHKGKDLLAFMK